MNYENSDILFASLLGSRVVEKIPRFSAVQNELMKHVLPPIPFLPFGDRRIWRADERLGEEEQFFPFSFEGPDGNRYLLPYEPYLSISGKNIVVRRNVAKPKMENGEAVFSGSVKERWGRGDYEITITGALYGAMLRGSVEDCFPKADFERLRDFLTRAERLRVYCEPLQLLGINYIVIEDFDFPFSKGENVQAYEIKAYSDFEHPLFIDNAL